MSKFNRSYYCKKIAAAAEESNKGKKVYGSEVKFHDDLDWETVENRGVWTDVYFELGGSSVLAFTICSSLAARGYMSGSVPEAIRDLETGLWDLYIHKKYISQKDVGEACKKWIEIQSPIKEIVMCCNVHFNGKSYGAVFTGQQYPHETSNSDYYIDDVYRNESFSNPIKLGICS